jgi:regulator of sigma E protease
VNLYLLAVIPVLGTMIIFHELGHFLAAKFFKVRVEAFSIGFGKRLIGHVSGDTDYKICALPLGGYVKMAGDNIGEGTGDPGEFLSKPRWQRFFIALMGPAFNVILSILLLTILFSFKYQEPAAVVQPFRVGMAMENSAAAKAGLLPGDYITQFDGLSNPNWEGVQMRVMSNPGQPLSVTYRRGDKEMTTTLIPDTEKTNRVGDAGWFPFIRPLVGPVDPQLPAAKVGIRTGDEIVAVDGKPVSWTEMTQLVQQSKGAPMHFTVRRGDHTFDAAIAPVFSDVPGDTKRWRIGVGLQEELVTRNLTLPQAFQASLQRNRVYATLIFDFLGKLIERKMSPRSLGGVIEISRETGEAAKQGLPDLIGIMALLSINLAIFNLLPIPILDGGVILLLLIEGALRRDLSLAVKEKVITVGFVFLVLFAVYVTYMDILRSLPPRFEKFLP